MAKEKLETAVKGKTPLSVKELNLLSELTEKVLNANGSFKKTALAEDIAQFKKLTFFLGQIYQNNPYWKEQFDEAGVDLSKLRSLEDFHGAFFA